MDFSLNSILIRAKQHLGISKHNQQHIFYAALETRYAIEVLLDDWTKFVVQGGHSLSEYLKELSGDDLPGGSIDLPKNPKQLKDFKEVEKIYAVKDYQNKINELAPEFKSRLEFMKLLDPNFKKMKVPDLRRINEYYGKIGAYLHYYKQEINIEIIYGLVKETLGYIESLNEPNKCFLEFTEEGKKYFDKFKSGTITEAELNEIKENPNKFQSGGLYSLG